MISGNPRLQFHRIRASMPPIVRRISTILLALLTAPLLIWPALANRYPLLFPDTLDYLGEGRPTLYALLHANHPAFHGMRSAIYSLGIYVFHLNRTPWPILALHAAIVAYPVYLTVRSVHPKHALNSTLAILAVLSILTSLSWYISLLMPDILGAPLYLAIYLLTFARPTLTRAEQGIVALLAIFCATAHTTHLLLAIVLCALLAAAQLVRTSRLRIKSSSLVLSCSVIAVAALTQLTINARLYGHATLDGNRPPYLEARLVADGPGKLFLRQRCAQLDWLLCRHISQLPDNDDDFLWAEGGIWPSATPAEQIEFRREELSLALATLRAYPRQQMTISLGNAARQLIGFGLDDFDNNDWMQANLETVLLNSHAAYARSLQSRDAVPWRPFTVLQNSTVLISLAVLIALFPPLVRRRSSRLLGLAALIITAVLANAAVTGALSEVDSRYQARVVWLIPFLAALFLLDHKRNAGLRRDRHEGIEEAAAIPAKS
jgi:hypothetical protein